MSVVGGLCEYHMYGTITNCYSIGDVNGVELVGGLVGYNEGTIDNSYACGTVVCGGGFGSIGGLVAENWGSVTNCYCSGSVSSDGPCDVGGLVGWNGFEVSNCFWDMDNQTHGVTESIGYNDGGTITNVHGLPTFQLQQQSTFTDWDFINVWDIGENQTYPYLRTAPASDINKDHITNFLDLCIVAEGWLKEE